MRMRACTMIGHTCEDVCIHLYVDVGLLSRRCMFICLFASVLHLRFARPLTGPGDSSEPLQAPPMPAVSGETSERRVVHRIRAQMGQRLSLQAKLPFSLQSDCTGIQWERERQNGRKETTTQEDRSKATTSNKRHTATHKRRARRRGAIGKPREGGERARRAGGIHPHLPTPLPRGQPSWGCAGSGKDQEMGSG